MGQFRNNLDKIQATLLQKDKDFKFQISNNCRKNLKHRDLQAFLLSLCVNKLQKLEDALVEQMLTSAKCAKDVKNAQKCAKGVRFSKIVQNVQKWVKCAKLCKICKVVQNVQTVQSCAKCAKCAK